jgi:hypothetical protein
MTKDSQAEELLKLFNAFSVEQKAALLFTANQMSGVVRLFGGPLDGGAYRSKDADDGLDWFQNPEHTFEHSQGKNSLYAFDACGRLVFSGFVESASQ